MLPQVEGSSIDRDVDDETIVAKAEESLAEDEEDDKPEETLEGTSGDNDYKDYMKIKSTEEDLKGKKDSVKHKISKEDLPDLKGFRKAAQGTPKEPNGEETFTLTLN